MSSVLIEALKLPDSCRLDKRVFKKLFLENAKLTPQDRRAFTNDVEEVVWRYTLKPSTTAIMPYADDEREYTEIAVLEISLKTPHNAMRIAEVVHRAIPYPLILAARSGDKELLSLAPKRFSRAEKGAIVAEEFESSGWINSDQASPLHREFLASLDLGLLAQTNYLALYAALVDRVIGLRSSCRTGEYHVVSDPAAVAQLKRLLTNAAELEAELSGCRSALTKESQFNRRVELNTEIKALELALHETVLQLGNLGMESGQFGQ